MKALLAKLAILIPISFSSHITSRDEGHIWTTPQDSINGSFIFPRQYPLTFREGSSINISWTKSYESVNLYFYQKGQVAKSVQLVTNLATDWYQWEVQTESTNLTNPFVFRAVNAQGTSDEQSRGGFWSTSWYLTRDKDASESIIPVSSTLSSSTSSSATASSSLPISSESFPSTTQGTTTEATAAPSTEASNTAAETHGSGVSKTAIIGLTIGLVVAGAIIIGGMFFYLRKRQRNKAPVSSPSLPTVPYHDKTYVQVQPVHEAFSQPSELQGLPPCYELPEKR